MNEQLELFPPSLSAKLLYLASLGVMLMAGALIVFDAVRSATLA